MNSFSWVVLAVAFVGACGTDASVTDGGMDASGNDAPLNDAPTQDAPPNDAAVADADAAALPPVVYAASATTLYTFDPTGNTLAKVGAFAATLDGGSPDSITDIAVAVDGKIWAISATRLYTAAASDGHVTLAGVVAKCGSGNFALTALANGKLYTADALGTVCSIDTTTITMTPLGSVGQNLALNDLVAIGDGTLYATAVDLSNASTKLSNLLVTLDPSTGAWTSTRGATGFPELLGVAYGQGKVIGFSHDGSGHIVNIEPTTGAGTLAGVFSDPDTHTPVAFAGAAVNANVPAN